MKEFAGEQGNLLGTYHFRHVLHYEQVSLRERASVARSAASVRNCTWAPTLQTPGVFQHTEKLQAKQRSASFWRFSFTVEFVTRSWPTCKQLLHFVMLHMARRPLLQGNAHGTEHLAEVLRALAASMQLACTAIRRIVASAIDDARSPIDERGVAHFQAGVDPM